MTPPGKTVAKSPSAFRTISEVAFELDVPPHVLRFWETRFPELRPVKRAGGRRYYRPEDVDLLRRIQTMLYTEGYTIKAVQRLLSEERAGASSPAGEPPSPSPQDEAVRRELQAVLSELYAMRALLQRGVD